VDFHVPEVSVPPVFIDQLLSKFGLGIDVSCDVAI